MGEIMSVRCDVGSICINMRFNAVSSSCTSHAPTQRSDRMTMPSGALSGVVPGPSDARFHSLPFR